MFDFGAVYELYKFEYYPRDSYGSGTVKRMNVYSSLDNVHWNLEWNGKENEEWSYDENREVDENKKTVNLEGVSARYLKLTIVESKKNFFAAHELSVYKKDGSKPFAVGSTNKNEKVSEGDYINMKNYLGTSVKDGANFVDQIQKRCGDINRNGVYDVYDYAFTMFALDGGTKQTGEVSGRIFLVPEREKVKAGETFTLAVTAKEAVNVNAFGKVLNYDPSRLEFVSASPEDSIGQMENLTVNKRYGDGTAYVNLAFANRGDKKLYNGSGALAMITMRAIVEVMPKDEMECEGIWLIGPGIRERE
ncbi:discoidin domain-containing protein [Sporofaciens musculi]|uniref:discoidin domain-containing protein n=1 Tax=Sporofaciens musculi TaxID=2681861 RepID=UPI00256FDF6C|nr:discoidin domain-containing protein [Sporofaciens musculi]